MVSHHEGLGICLPSIVRQWYCWWFRNPVNHLGCIKTLWINGIFAISTGEFTGFLNHQPYQICMSLMILVAVLGSKSRNRLDIHQMQHRKIRWPKVAGVKRCNKAEVSASQCTTRSLRASPYHLRCGVEFGCPNSTLPNSTLPSLLSLPNNQ